MIFPFDTKYFKTIGSFAFALFLFILNPPISHAQTTYNSTDTPINIDENFANTITSTLTISGSGLTIGDLNVTLDITHSWLSDLEITLSKGATSVILFNNSCGSNDDINMIADDQGSSLVCPPIGGNSYQPSGNLSDFDTISADGTWTLTIDDGADGDGGSLNNWSLIVTKPCAASAPTLSK